MSYSQKYNERRYCRQRQQTTEATGMSRDDTESAYTYETIKHRYGNHNMPCQKSKYTKDTRVHDSNNVIEPHRSHNAKCPVYVHHMKMQKHYSQNDAYQHSRPLHHQAEVYNYNKWDYYEDRTHYMKNKFDKLTLSNDSDQKHSKSECTRLPCPVHQCNKMSKSKKKNQSTTTAAKLFHEQVVNKLEESYWAKWNPKFKTHDRRFDAGEAKMIRTEADYNKRKAYCESERKLPIRCPDCFKCIVDNKDIKYLHKRTATKESKSSDFVKSDYDDIESPLDNESIPKTLSTTDGCDCPKGCPEKTKRLFTEDLPSTANGTFYEGSQFSGSCNNPQCPYRTTVSLEGQDIEEQLIITQYSNKILPRLGINTYVSAEQPIITATPTAQAAKKIGNIVPIDMTGETKTMEPDILDKNIQNITVETVTGANKNLPIDSMVTGDSKSPKATKQMESSPTPISTGPEGNEMSLQLKHNDSFILNSIKQNNLDGKPHYKQPNTIKLSNTVKIKGHSYPLKPILKKEKLLAQRRALHPPKKFNATNTKLLKTTIKKKL